MKIKKLILTNIPYLLFFYPFDKIAQAFRLAPGADLSAKIFSVGKGFASAFSSLAPSIHPIDILVGILGAVIIRLIVHFKSKKRKEIPSRRGIRLCTMGDACGYRPVCG